MKVSRFWESISCLSGSLVSLSSASLPVCLCLCIFVLVSSFPSSVSSMFPKSLTLSRSLARRPFQHLCVRFVCQSVVQCVQFASSCFVIMLICPSCVPRMFPFSSSPSGRLLCSRRVSRFPRIHARFSCLRLSRSFSSFPSLGLA